MSGFNDIATTNPELTKEWDYEKNDKLGYYMNNYTKGNATKVWWKCDKGHSYQSSINSKTSPKRTNCPYCSGVKILKGFNLAINSSVNYLLTGLIPRGSAS